MNDATTPAEPVAMLPPDHPVNRQLDAYNAHDLDRFIACFHPTCRLTTSDGTVRAEGHDALRRVYTPVFAIPGRRAEIVARIVQGRWVVDHELVHNGDNAPFEALMSYRLDAGEIVEMRSLD